ncbi:immune inhibitor A domain-containing protein [Microbulbifer sp. GL-2]|uniref:immune inhibitor A domain-containing protein n=1 Tax=Microbulbifer sp. GL-2 TaxID=2591606 RepID=UPI0011647082|nr:immune inhibitor A domain-containing protein [Microbulbifer sp. GL-2]BBM00540.1 immune inhibitor A [Microbulbifer sp. GL-2]
MLKINCLLPISALALSLMAANTHAAPSPQIQGGNQIDLVIANEAKLIDMLKRSGRISQTATIGEAERTLHQFLKERAAQNQNLPQDLSSETVQMMKLARGSKDPKLKRGKGKGHFHRRGRAPGPIEFENYDGDTRTAKVLAILMDFPDFPHNSIEPGETDMYYEDYAAQHYADLLFSQEGFTGPEGETLLSMQQFYWQQSGYSYSVEGSVAGWYTASQPAAFYGNNENGDARALVREALLAAAADPSVNLSDFDIEDRYDLDGDGNFWEADGLVDHIMIFHSSVGEEAGGGQLGEDAIWAHRWNLGGVFAIPGTTAEVDDWGGTMAAFDYTIQPADAAAGVVSHEYGHDLGLPDEYDTSGPENTGRGEPVSSWSVMSSGSWAGIIPGSEPTGFSAWAKEYLQHNHGGNWLHGETISLEKIPANGIELLLDEAVHKGTNNDAVRIDLPQKKVVVATPSSGEYAYFSGSDNNLQNSMVIPVDLTDEQSASLSFKIWYDIEQDWDYGAVMVDLGEGFTSIPGSITTESNPNEQNPGHGITGSSSGWVDAEFDLSAFAGKQFNLALVYITDAYEANPGFYADDITLNIGGEAAVFDDAEGESNFSLAGFSRNPGYSLHDHYYLLEWRTHRGVDQGLAHVNVAGQMLTFNEGLLVWYADTSFDNNWVGIHPGDGFLGVVDADQKVLKWSDDSVASTRYQIHDATFSTDWVGQLNLDLLEDFGVSLTDTHNRPHRVFSDRRSFTNIEIPDAGRAITSYGLKVRVVARSNDKSVGKIFITQ